jgi:hypothetical protein
VTVKNNSTLAAADVDAVKVSEFSHQSQILSVTPSQGTCAVGTRSCDLGRLGPGASATITAVTRATHVGVIVNTVRIGSEEQESNYLNNTAGAIARVTAPFKPPRPPGGGAAGTEAAATCRTLTAEPTKLRAGAAFVVFATARNLLGQPLRGVSVRLQGPHIQQRATTDARGVARFHVTPRQRGVLLLGGSPRSTASARSCRTVLAIVGSGRVTVTG